MVIRTTRAPHFPATAIEPFTQLDPSPRPKAAGISIPATSPPSPSRSSTSIPFASAVEPSCIATFACASHGPIGSLG